MNNGGGACERPVYFSMTEQMTLFETEPEKPAISPYEAKKVTVWFLKPDRLPKVYRRQFCHKNRAKETGMGALIAAASFGKHSPKPSKWQEDRFGVPYATAISKAGNTFKVEITNTRTEDLHDATDGNGLDI